MPSVNILNGNYEFLGWSTKPNTTDVEYQTGQIANVTGYQVFYAVTRAKKPLVSTYHYLDDRGNGATDLQRCYLYNGSAQCQTKSEVEESIVNGEILDDILNHYLSQDKPALSTLVPVEIFQEYGLSYSYEFNGNVPSGINILRSENVVQDEQLLIISRYELIFNVNTIETAILTNKFL